jgi:hypothetical protein
MRQAPNYIPADIQRRRVKERLAFLRANPDIKGKAFKEQYQDSVRAETRALLVQYAPAEYVAEWDADIAKSLGRK